MSGEDGFEPFGHHGGFADKIGPFYQRPDGEKRWRYGFRAEERHCNPQGAVHGGALYSFADHISGHAIVRGLERACATVAMKVEFLAPGPVGGWVEASCDIYRATRTMAFVRTMLHVGRRPVMSADGCFKLFGRIPMMAGGSTVPVRPAQPAIPVAVPEGFKAFSIQGGFPALYGPMRYRQEADGSYVCGLATDPSHDNTTGAVHGGAVFAFADDLMGRAVTATSRRYSATVTLDVAYLAAAPINAWLEGRAEITGMDDDYCFVRSTVGHQGKPLLTADGVWRLFAGFEKPEADPAQAARS